VRLLILLLLAASLALPLHFSRRKSITHDEVAHLPAGYSYLRTGKVVLNPMHPPLVKELCALPLLFLPVEMPVPASAIDQAILTSYQWKFGRLFFARNDVRRILGWCRLPAALLSLGLALVVTLWSWELWGPRGALVSLFLYVFDPTITAHAQLVTTDVPLAFSATLFFLLLRRTVRCPSAGRLIAAGIGLGLALATKFSAVVFVPVALGLLAFGRASGARLEDSSTASGPLGRRLRPVVSVLTSFALLLGLAAITVWAIYLFPSDPLFYWRGLESLQRDHLPNFDYILLGEVRQGRDPTYFLLAWLLKTPLPTIVLLAVAVVLFLRGQRAGALDESFLLVPLLAFFVCMSLFTDDLGVRYLIPCYPFGFIFTGRVGALLTRAKPRAAAAIVAALGWLAIDFVAVSPDHLSYFNEIAGGPRRGPEWLDDSNVDWGQGLIELREYLEERGLRDYSLCYFGALPPRHYDIDGDLIPWSDALKPPRKTLILSGHFVARVRGVLRLEYGDGPENWIAHAEPTAVVGHAYWVYEPRPGSS